MTDKTPYIKEHIEEHSADSRIAFGFWMYLMTDFVLFASLFAVFAVLRGNTFGGPSGADIFNMPYVLVETLLLLTSSVTSGFALLAARANKKPLVFLFLIITFILGAAFVSMEVSEFARLALAGTGWWSSGFLSSYFTLVGTHGLHVTLGLVWMLILMLAIATQGLTHSNLRKLELLNMFWHFLEIIWIFIFVIVYLLALV